MLFCNQCGLQLADQSRFCSRCGALTSPAGAAAPYPSGAPATLPPGTPAPVSYVPPSVPQTEPSAIISLVLGILSVTIFGILTGIPAVIVGNAARKKIRANPQQLTGEGLATAGIVTGWIRIVTDCILIVIVLIILVAAAIH